MAHLSGLDFKGADHPRLTCVQLRKTVNSLKDSFLRCPPYRCLFLVRTFLFGGCNKIRTSTVSFKHLSAISTRCNKHIAPFFSCAPHCWCSFIGPWFRCHSQLIERFFPHRNETLIDGPIRLHAFTAIIRAALLTFFFFKDPLLFGKC